MFKRFFIALFFTLPLVAQAEDIPAPLTSYVNDYIDLLPAAEEAELTQQLRALRSDNGIEMTVVLMDSRAPYGDDPSMEAFATRLFDTWGIGNANADNGILFLVLKSDRKTRIELGKAYGNDWNGTAARILDRDVLPFFAQDEYAKGVLRGSKEIIDTIALAKASGLAAPAKERDWVAIIFGGFFVAIAAVVFIPLLLGRFIRDAATRRARCPRCGQRSLDVSRTTNKRARRGSQGEKARRTYCRNCDYSDTQVWAYSLAASSSGSSSSGGSFGGGSSGGGGASGSW